MAAIFSGSSLLRAAQTRVSPPSTASAPPTLMRVLDLEAGAAEFRHARGDLDGVAEFGRLEEIGARIDQRDADDAEGLRRDPAA